ncbi:MAG: hypothetical protein U9N54_08170, partial [candidate division Zixibacteria bacterium]|nr:hypothetical protein [candidate division Zixibacteria bacterium]
MVFAQNNIDTVKTDIEKDSVIILNDSTAVESDSTKTSLIKDKYSKFNKLKKQHLPFLSIYDSLLVYVLSNRMNVASDVEKAYFHDVGDYFRFNPSFFVTDYQLTPMRKTVQPFGLAGSRINYFHNDKQYIPFEHLPEYGGMTDMNDFSIALNDNIYILPGPTGLLFGGKTAVASIVTASNTPLTNKAVTSFKSDNGNDGYSYTRGAYKKIFKDGRKINMSVGYRDADGIIAGTDDDSYHYTGDIFYPLGFDKGLRINGQLYDREGRFGLRLDQMGKVISRKRFDRNIEISYIRQNDSGDVKYKIGYYHYRQGSYTDGAYETRFNQTGHGVSLDKEWIENDKIIKAKFDTDYYIYDQPDTDIDRAVVSFQLTGLKNHQNQSFALLLSGKYGLHIGFLPQASLVLKKENDNKLISLSAGFSSREPSLHELFKVYQVDAIYPTGTGLYVECGNHDLRAEKVISGNFLYEIGTKKSRISSSITGGMIIDGIDWSFIEDNQTELDVYQPVNNDKTFFDVSLKGSLPVLDLFKFSAGGAYHFINNKDIDRNLYQPDYQLFASGQLHYYWKQKLIHFYVYTDLTYSGLYDGW